MKQARSYTIADKTGIASAILCTIHCLVVPVLVVLQGMYADTVKALPTWWDYLDGLFLIISFWAVYHAARHTGSKEIKTALWVSWIVLAVAIVYEPLHWLAYFASAGLITTHFINIRKIAKRATAPA